MQHRVVAVGEPQFQHQLYLRAASWTVRMEPSDIGHAPAVCGLRQSHLGDCRYRQPVLSGRPAICWMACEHAVLAQGAALMDGRKGAVAAASVHVMLS